MKLFKCIKCTFLISILALVYIHLQMQIIDLAYQGKEQEQEIKLLAEENGHVNYQICSLKSAHHIGSKMFTEKDEMQFADSDSVVQIVSSERINYEDNINDKLVEKKQNTLLSLLSIDFQREARAQE
jgi:hypothetical protein